MENKEMNSLNDEESVKISDIYYDLGCGCYVCGINGDVSHCNIMFINVNNTNEAEHILNMFKRKGVFINTQYRDSINTELIISSCKRHIENINYLNIFVKEKGFISKNIINKSKSIS